MPHLLSQAKNNKILDKLLRLPGLELGGDALLEVLYALAEQLPLAHDDLPLVPRVAQLALYIQSAGLGTRYHLSSPRQPTRLQRIWASVTCDKANSIAPENFKTVARQNQDCKAI